MTLRISLGAGQPLAWEHPVSVQAIAQSVAGPETEPVLAGKLDGVLVDLREIVDRDCRVEFVTRRDPEALAILRRSTALWLAWAVQRLYPGAQLAEGRLAEQGFSGDFVCPQALKQADLVRLDAEMRRLVATAQPLQRWIISRDEAIDFFLSRHADYQAEQVRQLAPDSKVALYGQGEFMALSPGPVVADGRVLGTFRLLTVSGAYWRGERTGPMLTRITGTAWAREQDLQQYLQRQQEAERRDHRRLARQMGLFHIQEEAPGMVFWHADGWTLWQIVEQYIRQVYRSSGYQEVRGPQLLDINLWKQSGHWDNYQPHMFFTESEKRLFAIKPMSCPGHVEIFKSALHSYRELPIRYAEFGNCHRNEPSGALHGLLRVRGFTQDDGHIFCTPEQIAAEVEAFQRQAMAVYRDFGFDDIALKLALRPCARIGSDAIWDRAEQALRAAVQAAGLVAQELPGEGAFYGPKLEYHLHDSMGRSWQLGTLQVDFMMPERLGAQYIDPYSKPRHPVMLHRAIIGSMERFLGILLEHYAGQLPDWLAPVQAVVLNVGPAQSAYAAEVDGHLQALGIRSQADLRHETLSLKIREHSLRKVPYLLVVGEREAQSDSVTVRSRRNQPSQTMPWQAFAGWLEAKPLPAG